MKLRERLGPRYLSVAVVALVAVLCTAGVLLRSSTVTKPAAADVADNVSLSSPIQVGSEPELSVPGEIKEDTYLGSGACASCHQEISASYATHPMANSTRPVEQDRWGSTQPNLPAQVAGTRRSLSAEMLDGKMVHSESMLDDSGKLIYKQMHTMDYVVGSGRRARAYLELRGNLLFMSPLNWYQKNQAWNVAPNYLPDDIRRFDRRANEDCVSCHAGRVATSEPGSNIYSSPPFHETAIGCERCHGPASGHVAVHEGKSTDQRADNIVNPAKLSAEQNDSVCYQCHLESAARILRPGKTHLDFRPGMKLSDIWAILDYGLDVTQDGRTRSVNHVQQMRDSRCFRESSEAMTCTACHDPHSVPAPEQRTAFYREKCLKCHTQQSCDQSEELRSAKQNDCAACHMPRLDSNNMAHVVQTDHRVLRRPLEERERAAAPMSLSFFADSAESFSPEERQRGLGLGTYLHCRRKGIPLPDGVMLYLEKSLQTFPDDVMLLNTVASMALQKNDAAAARNYYERACKIAPRNEAALDGLLETAYAAGDWNVSVECATRLLEIDPSSARIHAMRGDALLRLGRIDEAIAEVRQAAELNPGITQFHEWLIERYRERGLDKEAESQIELLSRVKREG